MKDKFGKKKRGTNLEILNKASQYFGTKGYDIIRYYFDTSPNEISKERLEKGDKRKCEICGKDLVRVSEKTRHGLTDDIRVRLKKHSVFVDSAGRKHYTCSGISNCLEKHAEDWSGEEAITKDEEYDPPTAEEFFEEYIELNKIKEQFRQALVDRYDKYVKKFLSKWVYRDISKNNVIDFIHDFQVVEENFEKLFIESPKDYKFFRTKLFRILGVNYGKE